MFAPHDQKHTTFDRKANGRPGHSSMFAPHDQKHPTCDRKADGRPDLAPDPRPESGWATRSDGGKRMGDPMGDPIRRRKNSNRRMVFHWGTHPQLQGCSVRKYTPLLCAHQDTSRT